MPEMLGKYYFAISFATIFGIFIDIGLFNVLTREVAKIDTEDLEIKKNKIQSFFSTVLAIKIPMALISLAIVVFLPYFLGYESMTKNLIHLSAASMVLDSFATTFYSVMRGFHNLKIESFGVFLFQIVLMIFGLLAIKLDLNLFWIMMALVTASIFGFCYSSFFLYFKYGIKLTPDFTLKKIKTMIFLSMPFATFAIVQRMYIYFDTVMINWISGDREVGLYQIPFKIIFALQFLPMAFTASLYPAFSVYWKSNKEQLPISFERAMNYLMIISLPISFGIVALAEPIIELFKPEYRDATLILQTVIPSLVFIFLNFPIGSLLNACDKQKINTKIMLHGFILSLILNYFLIHRFNALGAGITVVITNAFMFFYGYLQVPRIIQYQPIKNLKTFAKVLLATIVMYILAIILKKEINIFLNVIFSGFIYLFLLYLLKGYTRDDVGSIIKSFKKT